MGAPERFAALAEAMGENTAGMQAMKAAKVAVKAMQELCGDVGIPRLSSLGVDKGRLLLLSPRMAQYAMNSEGLSNTPRLVTEDDIITIYKRAM